MPDDIGWLLLCGGLTALGVVAAFFAFRTRGAASGLRMLGWAVFPIAAYLTGIVSLLWSLGERIVSWAGGIVFNTTVQTGAALFGLGIVLLIVGAFMRRRGGGAEPAAAKAKPAAAKTPTAKQGEEKQGKQDAQPKQQVGQGDSSDPLSGFEDIEEILNRRGIGDK